MEESILYEVEQLSQNLIKEAIVNQASDLHVIPTSQGYLVQMRIHGQIKSVKRLPSKQAERLISHLKYQSGMDIGERRKSQSSMLPFVEQNHKYTLRLSTLPATPSESLAIRISKQNSSTMIQNLPLLPKQLPSLFQALHYTYGLLLITGPTGSGKTTTLYSLLNEFISKKNRRVISIEDPIEQSIEQAVQIQINEKAGITFESGLHSILRHDPDVIVIGEIRDKQTAKLALRSALTGHYVLGTLHTHDCYSAIIRLLDFGLTRAELAEATRMIMTQRLFLPTCRYCERERAQECSHFLYRGRKAVYETLFAERLRETILNQEVPYRKLRNEVRLAWSLGYLEEEEIERQGLW
ncbi:hypothetical protein BALCAV_0210815 [Alkalihalobacillus alcalophilus ATCC 27647 = CGMCC 1.3604]|uniref:Bacterial type II secretion system protein E domain-containing protein n=1 Tax=Alkalihalobacillus alcalophilus ATCC 27647 = CGMCC 1.3604 TaxID=1218173 RepID=A0A094WKE0_ALKAL|nr:hypothetical protein BALCAV_0210815 [Alkalihalobacillus alcalophilus ATCC 27647 = CGMCC 1.3604]